MSRRGSAPWLTRSWPAVTCLWSRGGCASTLITPTAYLARIQAEGISAVASRCLEREGWSIMETEREMVVGDTTGHLDILAWHGATKRTAIIDLKTGQTTGAGWLQVGGYIQLLCGEGPAVECGGILHVPRVTVSKEPKATLEVRYGADLSRAWLTAKARIDAGAGGGDGPAVSWCALRAVRSRLSRANRRAP